MGNESRNQCVRDTNSLWRSRRVGFDGYDGWVKETWVRKKITFWQKQSPNCDSMGVPPYPLPGLIRWRVGPARGVRWTWIECEKFFKLFGLYNNCINIWFCSIPCKHALAHVQLVVHTYWFYFISSILELLICHLGRSFLQWGSCS
jgi:hypothetical protein